MQQLAIREKFLSFFKARGHTPVPSSSLLPNDPSVLFTTAGMQQFKPYYTGEADAQKDFQSLNTASVQTCVRTSDIDEVGDERHLTFFEMLGNFSFGGYFKKEAITWAHEFVTKEMGLTIDYVTVFAGEPSVPRDTESAEIWKSLDPSIEIRECGRADNFWGPTGDEGPCGPTTEIYVGGIEIWNVVFNQYFQKKDKTLEPLATPGIDTGMGLERLALVSQKVPTVFETDLFTEIMATIPSDIDERVRRVIADHARTSAFLIMDGVRPSNKDQGYVLRRLLRRMIAREHQLQRSDVSVLATIRAVISQYVSLYPRMQEAEIIEVCSQEREKFLRTLAQGLRELEKISDLTPEGAFKLYESFGLPYEVMKEAGGERAQHLTREAFDAQFKAHQEKSRAGAEKKFGGHGLLLDTGELKAADERELGIVVRLHTATHLLQAALRKVLGPEVHQAGSDITVERTRFDFTFPRKMTDAEIRDVESLVNKAIADDLPVSKVTLSREDAEKTGALHFFKMKYPAHVDVYTVGEGDAPDASGGAGWFSKEFCGGPHVQRTSEIKGIKIAKEEAVSAGVRRIRAVLVD
ncbi:MAG: alanine--tRNA ligase-related protein [Candidatus Paceibacterota bacterium]|nr:MAG: alanine--tRNA ligase-related protein [Candidatus Paceibacterota bacterium]